MLIFWILISIFFILFDIFTSSFIFFCFSIGGVASIIVINFGANMIYQIITFCIISIASICIFYPITRKIIKKSVANAPKMEDKYIGKIMIAEDDIYDKANIKISGIYWTVRNIGEKISKNEKFIITELEGNKFIIKKYKED